MKLPENESARTNMPEKLIRSERQSELNGLNNNPRSAVKIKVRDGVSQLSNNFTCLPADLDSSNKTFPGESQIDAPISLFSSVQEIEPKSSTTIRDFIKDVRDGRWKEQVAPLQQFIKENKRKEYNERKPSLPGATLSAQCASRAGKLTAEEKKIVHSGWLQADFDLKDNEQLGNADTLLEVRIKLLSDPYIGAVFCGPSGEGIKAIVRIDGERHRDSWNAAQAYFLEKYSLKLDKATKDPLRLCFVSYDPLAEVSEEFSPLSIPEIKKSTEEIWHPPLTTTGSDIAEMLKFIPAHPDYETWLRIASAVWSVLPMAEGCRLLAEWSPEEKEGEYATKHKHRLHQIGIGSLSYIASQHGFDARAAYKKRRWAGRIRFAESVYHPAEGEDPTFDPAPKKIITEQSISRKEVIDALKEGQLGDARLWANIRKGLRIWNVHTKMWMIYEKGIWRKDEGKTTLLDISDVLRKVYDGVIESVEKEMEKNPPADTKNDLRIKELKNLQSRRKLLGNYDYLNSVEKLATKEFPILATAFDANSELLALENGTLDFAEGVFREHRSADYLTHKSPITFDPEAKCPEWDSFLDYFMGGNEELIAYLARAVGYSLTGRVHEDALFFCYGKGANGKSTFFGGLQLLLGNLMTTVPISALLAEKTDNNYDYHKASMEGLRLVKTDEIPERRKLAENQIKSLVGGDDIAARRPYEKPYKFKPTHKLWLIGNHKLEIRGTDHGIWRRIHLIPWRVTITEEKKRSRHEVLEAFAKEKAGILNWAICGLRDLQKLGGLNPPDSVVAATKEYRSESDQFGQFLNENARSIANTQTKLKEILSVYKKWCEENGEPPYYGSSKKISNYFREAGYETKKIGHDKASCVFGVQLLQQEEAFALSNTLHIRS